jgi:tRNA (pseudouridine54-N1)-methyltransferase
MREFILRAQKSRTSDVDVDNLPDAGRFNIICSCIANAMYVSNHVRQDTIFRVVLEGPRFPPKIISIFGDKVKDLNFDERNIAQLLITCLNKGRNLALGEEIEVFAGIKVSKKSFESLVKEIAEKGRKMLYLHKKGKDIRGMGLKKEDDVVFVFGDFTGIPINTEKLLDRLGAEKISLGPVVLFASHCIILCQNELDRAQ